MVNKQSLHAGSLLPLAFIFFFMPWLRLPSPFATTIVPGCNIIFLLMDRRHLPSCTGHECGV